MSSFADIFNLGSVVFVNPWGALALLGIPMVIAIHCLQQKSRSLDISTLFLLEHLAPDSKEGRQLTWLRSSLPFWLQILCVLILTWLLLDPRWEQKNTVQRIVLVLDSSISMRAFTDDIVARTSPRLHALASLTPHTYWTLMETDPLHSTIYEGTDLSAVEKKLREWSPSLPAHDPTHALDLARSIAPRDALVIFLTDRPHDVPNGVDLLAIGEPIENSGLIGSRVIETDGQLEWQVVVQNYGQKPSHRFWWIELAGQKTEQQVLDLEPGHSKILKGKFPPGMDRLEVCLDPDRFSTDDRMPIIRPQPKQLTVDLRGTDSTVDLFARLAQTLPSLATVQQGQPADMAFLSVDPHGPILDDARFSVVLLNDPQARDSLQGGPYLVEDDPLNQDLNWQGLIIQPGHIMPQEPTDHVLVWKDHTPVIFIRSLNDTQRRLVFNFNFPASNATRLPAFLLLINRFVESVRMEKLAPETRNVELAENLTVAARNNADPVLLHQPDGTLTSATANGIVHLRAPSLSGFFSVTQGNETLLTGAAQYADARESDFSPATAIDTLATRRTKLLEMHARAEMIAPLWLILIGILLALNWRANSPRTS